MGINMPAKTVVFTNTRASDTSGSLDFRGAPQEVGSLRISKDCNGKAQLGLY